MEFINYDLGKNDLKNWLIEEASFDSRNLAKFEAIFTQGNGYLGVRNALDEAYKNECRNMFVSGTFNKASENEVTELPNLPDVTNFNIAIDGHLFSLEQGKIKDYSRVLNLKNGETIRKITWLSPSDIELEFEFRRIVSLDNYHLMASSIDFTSNKPCAIKITSGIDGSMTNSGAQHFLDPKKRIYDGKIMELAALTRESRILTFVHSCLKYDIEVDVIPSMGRRTLYQELNFNAQANKKYHFEKISTVSTSRDLDYTKETSETEVQITALKRIQEYGEKSYAEIKKASAAAWEQYWQLNDVLIKGNAQSNFDQLAIRFALYHLRIMTNIEDNRVGIAAKGLSGEGYKGHSFWDTELFILPYFIYTQPEVARTLLEYRYKNLYGAYKKAEEEGYEGAMYPWESAWITDGEVTPKYQGADVVTGETIRIWTGDKEIHISADIAYAVDRYFQVTKDLDFMEKYGFEIIIATGLFWSSRWEYNAKLDRYEINDVIGPDEYKEHVDNNAYTNYMARYNMDLALKVIDYLSENNQELYDKLDEKLDLERVIKNINKVRDKVYLPQPNEDGIIPQNEQYLALQEVDLSKYLESEDVLTILNDMNMEQLNKYMISKQADTVMLLFLFRDLFSNEIVEKNFKFYENRTLHDSSLSYSTHSIVANELGLNDFAYDLFEEATKIDLGPNMSSSDRGIHSASLGGIWESVIMGFAGVRVDDFVLRINPNLPKAWSELSFRIKFHGNPLMIKITDSEVSIENLGSEDVNFVCTGEKQDLDANSKKTLSLN